jgi:hypothetical protein
MNVDEFVKFSPINNGFSVYFNYEFGPSFGVNSLSIEKHEFMNAPDNGRCFTNGKGDDQFNIPTDPQGNSILTGDGQGKPDNNKTFTLSALETWALTF